MGRLGALPVEMHISVLASGIKVTGNENAVLFPLIKNKDFLQSEYGVSLSFYTDHKKLLKNKSDKIILSSWYPGRKLGLWKKDRRKLESLLISLRNNCDSLIWYDISDSTGTTQFEVLDLVDVYWKCQLLSSVHAYRKPTVTGRVFSDYFSDYWLVDNDIPQEPHLLTPPSENEISKIKLAWNTGLSDYSLIAPIKNRVYRNLGMTYRPRRYATSFKPARVKRNNFLSCRFGTSYERNSVSIGREKTAEYLSKYKKTNKLNRFQYFNEMANSNFVISPFGLGEITLRDFEAFLCGAVVIKPKMSHMQTWPNFFSSDNIIEYQWNLENFIQIIEECRENTQKLRDMAEISQSKYLKYTSGPDSTKLFCARLFQLLA